MRESSKRSGAGSGFSRRDFLKGSGAVAAATALQSQAAEAAQTESAVVRGQTVMPLEVNGKTYQVKVEPRTTLLEVLRYQIGLTGAKPVSADGLSGASSVWVDGKLVTASTTLALACQGKKVRTVESFGADDAVVQAMVDHDGLQCGFCTPGFVVAVHEFLKKHPNATEEEIRAGLNGNLCRCGTYERVVSAVLAVVKGGGNG